MSDETSIRKCKYRGCATLVKVDAFGYAQHCEVHGSDTVRYIEVVGDERDIEGLIESVLKRFGVRPSSEDNESLRYEEDGIDMRFAFGAGLTTYILGFVDSKVDGTLRVVEHVE